jgi:hypothetical protein
VRTVTPAHGRDYTSAKAAAQAWRDGKDFLLADPRSPWNGRPISSRDCADQAVRIRYARLTRVVTVAADGQIVS